MIGQYVQAVSVTGRVITGTLRETDKDYYIIDGSSSIFYLPIRNTKSIKKTAKPIVHGVKDAWSQPIIIIGQ